MATIELTQGQRAIVDERDYQRISRFKWCAYYNDTVGSFYACRGDYSGEKRRTVLMHRFVLGLRHGDRRQVDHENHDTLDNRRSNLKVVTQRENHENRKHHSRWGIGIFRDKRCRAKPFRAQTRMNGKVRHIGFFATAEEAQEARKKFLQEEGK